jgi:hypothetical protein
MRGAAPGGCDHDKVLATRLALAAVALVVCGWFVLGVRSAHDQQAVTALVNRPGNLTTAQAAHALHQLGHAGTANPDGALDILRAEVVLRTGNPGGERRILRGLVAREPMNIDGWFLLYDSPPTLNPDARRAYVHVQELAPHVPAAP